MLNFKQKLILTIAGLTASGLSFAIYCDYLNGMVTPVFLASTGAIVGAVTAVDGELSALAIYHNQRMLSALAVLTKQKAIAANQVSQSTKNAYQIDAQALNTLAQADRVKQARFDYGPEFGQGYNPCTISVTRKAMTQSLEDTNTKAIQDMEKEVINHSGNYAQQAKTLNNNLNMHREKYCTLAQVKAGLCAKVGAYAGKSINLATLFTPAPNNSPEHQAKVDFINNLAGLPDNPLPNESAKSVMSRSYMQLKQQKDAFLSPALYSLKKIQNDYVENKGVNSSLADMFDKEANRYMGVGTDGSNWAKTMAAQNQRGLLIEMLKVKSLDLAIQARQYEQQERIEANLAVLVANAAGNLHVDANNLQTQSNGQK